MATAQAPNPRASLLSGLRTGGVRSASGPMGNVPHSAAACASFNFPRYASNVQHYPTFPEEDEDELGEIPPQNFYVNTGASRPVTAAVDGPNNRFSHQQSRMNANSPPFVPSFAAQTPQAQAQAQAQAQVLQEMQLLQMEVMRLQTVQAQQYQAGVHANYLAELARQQIAHNAQSRRTSFNPPSTAGPQNASFDLRSATLSAQSRRANQAELLKAQLGLTSSADDQVPMSAALGGKFGGRSLSNATPPNKFILDCGEQALSAIPAYTTVISGGTPLGTPTSGSFNSSANSSTTNVNAIATTPSKSDSAASWRRGGNNNSVLSGNNRAATLSSSPTVRVTPPPPENPTPPPGLKARPLPLRFSAAASQPMPVVAIDTSTDGVETIEVELPSSSGSSSKSASSLSPTTSPSSAYGDIPLSPREEATKKLYEGLGIGRPVPVTAPVAVPQAPPAVSLRMTSQPTRQPRGPPSGADELGPKNFATRIRRKAIGGLGVLMGARERREAVEAY